MLSSVRIVNNQRKIVNRGLPPQSQLIGIIKFLESNKDKDYLIYSNYNFSEDFVAMKFSYVLRPSFTKRHIEFLDLNIYGDTPMYREKYLQLLNSNQISTLITLHGCERIINDVKTMSNPPRVLEITSNGTVKKCSL